MSTAGQVMNCGDLLMWERYTTKEHKPDGSVVLTLVDGVMPDGKPCTATLAPGWKPRTAIDVWFNYVRGEYDARETKQEAASAKRKKASGAGGERQDTAPRVYGGSEIPTEEVVQAREASVEALLESKVADLTRSVARVEDQISTAMVALAGLEAERSALKLQRHKAIAAIRAMKETKDVG